MSELPQLETPVAIPALVTPAAPPPRLLALDAFRGLIMLMMASAAFGVGRIAREHPRDAIWQAVGWHCDHAVWVGCSLWDLIQPSFMFMVGTALAFSAAKRKAGGQNFGQMLGHALWRGLVLVLLAVFLTSANARQTDWTFPNVLAQIGLGYPFLFLLSFTRSRTLGLAALGILAGYWALFAAWPLPPTDFDWGRVGVPPDWPHLTGFAAHWEKNANFAAWADQWFLNLFPREKPFVFNAGGYQTLNFVPSLATMIFGLLAGRLMLSSVALPRKVGILVLAGVVGLASGWLLDWTGANPMVKRIWTPAFALFSGGWVALLLAGFVAVMEWGGWRRWAFPLLVAGLNPITLYVLWQLMAGFIKDNFRRHFGPGIFESFGPTYVQMLERGTVLLVLWLILLWMYRRKIVIRI